MLKLVQLQIIATTCRYLLFSHGPLYLAIMTGPVFKNKPKERLSFATESESGKNPILF